MTNLAKKITEKMKRYNKGVYKDIKGHKFGKLTAISRIDTPPGLRSIWLCEGECGKTKEVILKNLTTGYTKSCGCLCIERNARFTSKRRKPGQSFFDILIKHFDLDQELP